MQGITVTAGLLEVRRNQSLFWGKSFGLRLSSHRPYILIIINVDQVRTFENYSLTERVRQENHNISLVTFLLSCFFFVARQPPVGHGHLIHEVSRSHSTTHHSRQDSSGRVISSSQRPLPLPDNTWHSQQTNIHAPSGIRTHNLSRRAAVDLQVRMRGHWDRRMIWVSAVIRTEACFWFSTVPSSKHHDNSIHIFSTSQFMIILTFDTMKYDLKYKNTIKLGVFSVSTPQPAKNLVGYNAFSSICVRQIPVAAGP